MFFNLNPRIQVLFMFQPRFLQSEPCLFQKQCKTSPWNLVLAITLSFLLHFQRFLRSRGPCNMYSSFSTSFCTVYIVWCIVSYLLYLPTCMYLCDAIEGAPFEDSQEQGFEGVEQQQDFEEDKCSLNHIPVLEIFNVYNFILYACMSL